MDNHKRDSKRHPLHVFFKLRLWSPILITSLLLLLLGRTAFASIPDPSNVFHGCVTNATATHLQANSSLTPGTLRVIDTASGQKCATTEKAVTWNQSGPQGPQGPQGAKGDTGAPGPAGVAALPSPPELCPGCNLSGANFNGVNLEHAYFGPDGANNPAHFASTYFIGADLTSADMAHALFGSATLTNANLTDANLAYADLTNVTGNGANLHGASMFGAKLSDMNLANADLTNANLGTATGGTTATIIGVTWNNTICPDQTNSDAHGNTCVGYGF